MNILLSLLYAPLIFLSLRYFDIKSVAFFIFIFSLFWLLLSFPKGYKKMVLPIFYLLIAIISYFSEAFIILKSLPLLISSFITLVIFVSYMHKNSIIFYFAKKIQKKEFSKDEQEYIHRSTLFWLFISLMNVLIHTLILFNQNLNLWIFYSSIGWYFIFIVGGVIQFTHRKLVFLKKYPHE